jgi:hypothetical protein
MTAGRELTPFELAALVSATRGDPALAAQIPEVHVARRDYTNMGCFVELTHASGARGKMGPMTQVIRGPHASVAGLEYGIRVLVYVDEGLLACIEAHTYGDEKWPKDLDSFQLA